jgi:hypothetical protein
MEASSRALLHVYGTRKTYLSIDRWLGIQLQGHGDRRAASFARNRAGQSVFAGKWRAKNIQQFTSHRTEALG